MQHNLSTNLQSPKLHWEERRHHKRPYMRREHHHSAGSTSSPTSRGCSALQSRCPNLQLPYLFRNVRLLPNFPMAHGLTVIQKRAGRCLAASSSLQQHWQVTQLESKQTISLKWATPAKFFNNPYFNFSLQNILLLYGAMVKQALQHNILENTLAAFRTI